MGGVLSFGVSGQFQKQQEFMIEMNRITMERQIQMQNQMRERLVAQQLARSRELLVWLGSFAVLASIGMARSFMKTRNGTVLAPILPLSFVLGYQYDLAYGSKISRIKAEAENILMFESDQLEMPWGLPTVASLDMARIKMQDEAKFKAISRD